MTLIHLSFKAGSNYLVNYSYRDVLKSSKSTKHNGDSLKDKTRFEINNTLSSLEH